VSEPSLRSSAEIAPRSDPAFPGRPMRAQPPSLPPPLVRASASKAARAAVGLDGWRNAVGTTMTLRRNDGLVVSASGFRA
jgi:hypothetical protein